MVVFKIYKTDLLLHKKHITNKTTKCYENNKNLTSCFEILIYSSLILHLTQNTTFSHTLLQKKILPILVDRAGKNKAFQD